MLPSRSFWRGRRVLLTGHTGFKGAWLAFWLTELGVEVVGFSDRLPTQRSLFESLDLGGLIQDRRGDIRNASSVSAVVADADPDVVLHLAAQSLVRYSYANPAETYATNVMGTVHVLEAARAHRTGLPVVVVTTDKCYENREWLWGYRETEPMGGHDPYSSSKGCAELVTSAYARSYMTGDTTFKTLSARAGNVIGGGDWAQDRLIPDLIRGLTAGEPVAIRNPDAIRPWQHVLEPLCGYLLLAQGMLEGADVAGQGWNFGPDPESEVSVRRVADGICRFWDGERGWLHQSTPGQHHEAGVLRLDSTKSRNLLGWRPRWTLDRALEASAEVYRSNASVGELRDLIRRQIDDYTGGSRSDAHLPGTQDELA